MYGEIRHRCQVLAAVLLARVRVSFRAWRRNRVIPGLAPEAASVDPPHVPDRRTGTNPAEDRRAGRRKGHGMTKKRRRPCWYDVDQAVKLMLTLAEGIVQLIRSAHGG